MYKVGVAWPSNPQANKCFFLFSLFSSSILLVKTPLRPLGFLFRLLPFLLLGRQGPQLQGVDAALGGHLVAQEAVHEAVTRGLHLGPEGLGCDDEAEVRLPRCAALHGLVVRMLVGVVKDL